VDNDVERATGPLQAHKSHGYPAFPFPSTGTNRNMDPDEERAGLSTIFLIKKSIYFQETRVHLYTRSDEI
jgi:hypothetical protein